MREIKFRAKATEEISTDQDGVEIGDFIEGFYYFDRSRMSGIIVTTLMVESGGVGSGIAEYHIEVDYKTLGEWTGLKDKNGKKVYEGDIVKGNFLLKYEVFYKTARWMIGQDEIFKYRDDLEVIGNIYENPEFASDTLNFRKLEVNDYQIEAKQS